MDRDQNILDYVQDRLSTADRAKFEDAMVQDTSLAAEVDVMRSLRAALSAGPVHEKADAVWQRLSTEISDAPRAANDNQRPWRHLLKYAAVAVFAVAAWQTTVAPRLLTVPEGYRAASDAAAEFTFQVKFTDGATLADIADVLAPFGGRIIDGPSALGLVRISVSEEDLVQDAQTALEMRTDLVEFVAE
ncbi:MAG: hypothetical protein AB8B58_16965 [Roseobacter sp.]